MYGLFGSGCGTASFAVFTSASVAISSATLPAPWPMAFSHLPLRALLPGELGLHPVSRNRAPPAKAPRT
ncbi:hypothetical protein AWN90_06045 [Nocardia terpenica]|uniref:Uncharacterized protein n=1 Tax=Nocardia terpenica TaxID=455432 RepID=A0A164J7R2_9NOCA|nr:hypothetical protein AWN90_06045 [Nocardia terpenica]